MFSLYHIFEHMNCRAHVSEIITSGGAGDDPCLSSLKATLFDLPVYLSGEKDTSALGAALFAAVGAGWFTDIPAAMRGLTSRVEAARPIEGRRSLLLERYEIYKGLYPALKDSFKKWSKIIHN